MLTRSNLHGALALTAVIVASTLAAELPAQDARTSHWNITTGAGVLVLPEYPGSDEYRVLPFPLTEVTYRDRVYLGASRTGLPSALGAYAIRTDRLGFAVEVGAQPNRRASRADALAGTEDREWAGSLGASLSYRVGPVEALVGLVQGFNDGAGILGTTTLSVSRPFGRLLPTIGLGATFADAKQMHRDFGVTLTESSRRQALIAAGDRRLRLDEGGAYRPNGGLRHVTGAVSLIYVLSRRWSVMSFGGVNGLSVDAQDSPLVRRRDQYFGSGGLAYHF